LNFTSSQLKGGIRYICFEVDRRRGW